jgi:hypothetical protein
MTYLLIGYSVHVIADVEAMIRMVHGQSNHKLAIFANKLYRLSAVAVERGHVLALAWVLASFCR